MQTLNHIQTTHVSAGSAVGITGTTALIFALCLYYTQEDQNKVKFQELENRLSKLEALANLNDENITISKS